ncbi:P-loop containing nucleoside triphosphate hydrolase protein [Mycena vulgaris]|nr:P-loop containing nucleoside triphosphate hydrolase protein [Mycena vulgaris]
MMREEAGAIFLVSKSSTLPRFLPSLQIAYPSARGHVRSALTFSEDWASPYTRTDYYPPGSYSSSSAASARNQGLEFDGMGTKECSHCHTTSTPLWRRDPRTHRPLCNACGLYLYQNNELRPTGLVTDSTDIDEESEGSPECNNCGTRRTTVWRRNSAGHQVCNACGLYERMNGKARPLTLRKDKIRPRVKLLTARSDSASHTYSMDPGVPQEAEVTIAVLGPKGSGKTSFTNIVSGSNLPVGHGPESGTNKIQVAPPFQLHGRWITLIDTPGFDDTSNTEILTEIALFLAKTYKGEKRLAGVIYMQPISDRVMSSILVQDFKLFKQLCGDGPLENIVIATNRWGEVAREVGEASEAKLHRIFKPVLDKGARLLRHDDEVESAQAIIHSIIENQLRTLHMQHELRCQICEAEFTTKYKLRRHLNAHNAIK